MTLGDLLVERLKLKESDLDVVKMYMKLGDDFVEDMVNSGDLTLQEARLAQLSNVPDALDVPITEEFIKDDFVMKSMIRELKKSSIMMIRLLNEPGYLSTIMQGILKVMLLHLVIALGLNCFISLGCSGVYMLTATITVLLMYTIDVAFRLSEINCLKRVVGVKHYNISLKEVELIIPFVILLGAGLEYLVLKSVNSDFASTLPFINLIFVMISYMGKLVSRRFESK